MLAIPTKVACYINVLIIKLVAEITVQRHWSFSLLEVDTKLVKL